MKCGAFFPNRPLPTVHAMAADDLPLHFDMEELTEKQKRDHFEQNQLLAMLQIALLSISKPEDYVALFDAFNEEPWRGFLAKHHDLMTRTGMSMVPMDHLLFAPVDSYYETIAEGLPPVELVNFLMMSRSNEVIHQDQAAIDRMLKLNSKFHFAEHAPAFGIPIPETLIATQPLAGNAEAEQVFARHDNQIILKMTGQPGARNVAAVNSIDEAETFLEAYRTDDPVLVQQRLPLDQYAEWTADLLVTDGAVSLDNVRRILVADGLWIGNHIPVEHQLTEAQEDILLNVGRYVQQFGFGTEIGDNLGIDYFVGPEGEIIITEINPRWTAGLFPTQALRRVDRQGRDAVAYFELVNMDQYDTFLNFVGEHLPGHSQTDYATMALGFSPYEYTIDGQSRVYCWMVVLGDFKAYHADAGELLGPGGTPNGDLVPV